MELFGITLSSSNIYLLSAAGGLTIVIITIIATRRSNLTTDKIKEREATINNILTPFNDLLLNIEAGELNHIHIMNSLFENQKTAIAHAKSIANPRKKQKIEKAWQEYETFYSQNAKGQVLSMFADLHGFEDVEKEFLHHINAIVAIVKKI